MPFNPLNSSNSLDQNFGQTTDMFRELYDRQQTEIFKDATGTRRVMLGDGGNGFYGLKVSKPTFDVFTTADSNLAFNSNQNTFKIVSSGTVVLPAFTFNTGGASYKVDRQPLPSTQVVHNLGYVPAFLAFDLSGGNYSNSGKPYMWSGSPSSGFVQAWTSVFVDATTAYFYAEAFGYNVNQSIGGWTIKYYLLQETAN